jgi:hypothetical protein
MKFQNLKIPNSRKTNSKVLKFQFPGYLTAPGWNLGFGISDLGFLDWDLRS